MVYVKNYLDFKKIVEEGGKYFTAPSNLQSHFLIYNLDKFGIQEAPTNYLKLIEENKITLTHGKHSQEFRELKYLYSNPDSSFSEKKLQSTYEEEKDFYTDKKGAALLFSWYVKNKVQFDDEVELEEGIELEDIKKEYISVNTIPFIPSNVEKLLKLFSLFYNKKLTPEEIEFISKTQLLLEMMISGKDRIQAIKTNWMIQLIQRVQIKEKGIHSGLFFDKLYEEFENIAHLQKDFYYFSEKPKWNQFAYQHNYDSEDFFREEFDSLFQG